MADEDSSDEEIEIEEREYARFENVNAQINHFEGVNRMAAEGGGVRGGLMPPRVSIVHRNWENYIIWG